MPVGSLIGGGFSLVNGILQRNAAKKAAEQQAQKAKEAQDHIDSAATGAASGVNVSAGVGRDKILDTLGLNDPYTAAGSKAVTQASGLTSAPVDKFAFDSSTLGMDPGYLFRKAETNKRMKQDAAAGGSLWSGGFEEALMDRTSQEASQEVSNQFNRQLTTFNTNQTAEQQRIAQLMGLTGVGQKANDAVTGGTEDAYRLDYQGASDSGKILTDAARADAGLITGTGTANAVGTYNSANATTGMFGNLAKVANGIDWASIFKKKTPVTA